MPTFDFRGIRCGKYNEEGGNVTYTEHCSIGEAMNCNLQMRFAEGRLYAESSLAEYLRKATGGTISIGVKYIPTDAQKLMFGASDKTRKIGEKQVPGLVYSAKDKGDYIGVAMYAPDLIDGEEKYTCLFIMKSRFGHPGWNFQTMGENITFQTPTTTGEFLVKDKTGKELLEVAVCDDEDTAIAWTKLVLGETEAEAREATEPANTEA